MNSRRSDFELLREFVPCGNQATFADVVRRHVDLVFGTAMRKVQDEGAAQEVAQNVFSALAKKAWQFAPDDSLPAWLYRTALLEAQEWLRGELRRRRREETAAELGTTMKTQNEGSTYRAFLPLLDDALLSLREKDRTALLLRFFEGQSLREIGASLGVGEDAAQKRVASALDKVASFFQRRGFQTVTVAAITVAFEKSAAYVSAASASLVVNASLQAAPSALTGLTALLGRVAGLSKVQTAAVCAGIAILSIGWQWNQAQASSREAMLAQQRTMNSWRLRNKRPSKWIGCDRNPSGSKKRPPAPPNPFAREQEAKKRLETLRARSRALLAAQDYRWPDDLPFVRIPKSALSSIEAQAGPQTPAVLQAKISNFLDLTPRERETTSQIFSNYFASVDALVQANSYETNQAVSFKLPPGAQSTVFVLEPTGPGIRAALDRLSNDLSAALGPQRWEMVVPDQFEFTHYEQVRLLGYTTYAWDQRQEFAVNIFTDANGEPSMSWQGEGGTGSSPCRSFASPGVLDALLPQGPPSLMARVKDFMRAQATAAVATPSTR